MKKKKIYYLVPTLCVGTPAFDAPRHTLDAERRRKYVPTRSVGTRDFLASWFPQK